MTLTVHYFGLLAERRGLAREIIECSSPTPAGVYELLDSQHQLGLSISNFRVAVNDEFVGWDHPLGNNDTLAFLPPMSGG